MRFYCSTISSTEKGEAHVTGCADCPTKASWLAGQEFADSAAPVPAGGCIRLSRSGRIRLTTDLVAETDQISEPTQLKLLVYLYLRTDKHSLCYPTLEEIADELGQETISRLRRTIRELETLSFIQTRTSKGRAYFLVGDPSHALLKLRELGTIGEAEVEEANELLSLLKLPQVSSAANK